jgi:hypothetical protein
MLSELPSAGSLAHIGPILGQQRARRGPLLHRPRLLMVMGRRAPASQVDVGVRRRAQLRLGDGRPGSPARQGLPRRGGGDRLRTRLLRRPDGALARRRGRDRDALRPADLDAEPDFQHLPGVHGGEGRKRAGMGGRLPLPATPARGADVRAAQARPCRSPGRRGRARGPRCGALQGRPQLARDHRAVRRRPRRGARRAGRGPRSRHGAPHRGKGAAGASLVRLRRLQRRPPRRLGLAAV